jgi:hypothetical protein
VDDCGPDPQPSDLGAWGVIFAVVITAALAYRFGYDIGHARGVMSSATRKTIQAHDLCLIENEYDKVFRWVRCK